MPKGGTLRDGAGKATAGKSESFRALVAALVARFSYQVRGFDVLATYNTEATGAVHVGKDGEVAVSSGAPFGLRVAKHAPPLQRHWAVAIDLIQKQYTRGYLFAKTTAQGANRYYALYSNRKGLRFYYTTKAGDRDSALFKTQINDGLRHKVVLSSDSQHVYLHVDGRFAGRKKVTGPVADCGVPSDKCFFYIGQRRGDRTGTAWSLSGVLYSFSVLANKAVRGFPTVVQSLGPGATASGAKALNLLDVAAHDGAVPVRSGVYLFSGSGAGLVVKPAVPITPTMAVAVRFKSVPRRGGYIFAKTSARGTAKHLGIFVSDRQRDVAVYFQKNGKPGVARFKVDLSDGKEYRVVVNIDQGAPSLLVDDVHIESSKAVARGLLQDCDRASKDCTVHVGDRVSRVEGAWGWGWGW